MAIFQYLNNDVYKQPKLYCRALVAIPDCPHVLAIVGNHASTTVVHNWKGNLVKHLTEFTILC